MTGAAAHRRRGEPVVALATIAVAWIAFRALAWQSPPDSLRPHAADEVAAATAARAPARHPVAFAERRERTARTDPPNSYGDVRQGQPISFAALPPRTGGSAPASALAASAVATLPLISRTPGGQSLPLEPGGQAVDAPAAGMGQGLPRGPATVLGRRSWTVDTWIAWRAGGTAAHGLATGQPLAAAYGGSQAGVLARFDLGDQGTRPQAYARLLHAPGRARQSEAAIGLGTRPLARLPVRLQAEVRATRSAGTTIVRPAVLAVSELLPRDLPLGLRVHGYAQAGYVGGRFATAFADGHLRLEREVLAMRPARLSIGAGAWGGAQADAGRLDVGPSASVDLAAGPVPARLSIDYRRRVAGAATPDHGMALTLSTGF